MPEYTLTVLGREIAFSADITQEQLQNAVALLETRYRVLEERAGLMSKERLLTYLALSLADDYLHDQNKISQMEQLLHKLILRIDSYEKSSFSLEGSCSGPRF